MLSIVIPFKGDQKAAQKLMRLFELIINNGSKNNFEVIIVDSSDAVSLVHPNLTVIRKNVGVGEARNIGVKVSEGDVILFIDADCMIPRGFIDKAYELALETGNEICAVGGPVECIPTKSVIQKYLDYSLFTQFPRVSKEYIFDLKNCYRRHPNMCNLIVKKRVFLEVGGCWNSYGEDVYFILKLIKNGYKIKFSPQLKIYHDHPSNVTKLARTYYRNGKSAAKIVLTFFPSSFILYRLFRYLVFTMLFLFCFFLPILVPILFASLSAYYLIRTHNWKSAILYPILDVVLQIVYIVAFSQTMLKESMSKVRAWMKK